VRSAGFVRRLVVYVAAGVLIAVGLAGIVLPLLPGWPLIIVGVVLLTGVSPWVRGALHRFLNRHPRLDAGYLKIRALFTRTPPSAASTPGDAPPTA
jgi:uncharacterized membrane protein YbaN (DUF454 family)